MYFLLIHNDCYMNYCFKTVIICEFIIVIFFMSLLCLMYCSKDVFSGDVHYLTAVPRLWLSVSLSLLLFYLLFQRCILI